MVWGLHFAHGGDEKFFQNSEVWREETTLEDVGVVERLILKCEISGSVGAISQKLSFQYKTVSYVSVMALEGMDWFIRLRTETVSCSEPSGSTKHGEFPYCLSTGLEPQDVSSSHWYTRHFTWGSNQIMSFDSWGSHGGVSFRENTHSNNIPDGCHLHTIISNVLNLLIP
jgi:hypothetical protein